MSATNEPKKGPLSWYFRISLLWRIMFSLILGALVGIVLGRFFPESVDGFIRYSRFFGDLFIRLLKMIVVPVILFSLIGGAASIAPTRLGRVGVKIMAFYLVTSAFAVVIGLGIANITKPGGNFHVLGDTTAQPVAQKTPDLATVLLNIVPTNPVEALANGDILPIIFFAILFGVGISFVKESPNKRTAATAETLYEVCTAAAETMYKIVAGIMQYAPIGVFVLIAIVFAEQGHKALGPLLMVVFTVYAGILIHLFLVYGGCLAAFGLGLHKFVSNGSEPMITAFVTRSSSGTLPITLQVTEDRLGAPRSISSFSLPLGATINMDGTAIYLGVCAMFIGFATDTPLTFQQQATIVIAATLASIGTAGVPGAGAIMLLMVMDSINLPIVAGTPIATAYAMILGIDALLDMGRTGLNVTGDMVGTVVVSKSEKLLDESKWR